MTAGARITKRLSVAMAVIALAAGCAGPEEPEPPKVPLPSVGESPPALTPVYREAEHGASLPTFVDSRYTASLPSTRPPAASYRSEAYWSQDGASPLRLNEGDAVDCTFSVTPKLGAAATIPGQWTVLWQMQGPLRNGSWPAPPLSLHVSSGTWHFGGGAGRPRGRETYAPERPSYTDGKLVTWRFAISVSADPKHANVNAWLDGRKVVDNWHPPSGTRYPEHSWLGLRTGIYTGSSGNRALSAEAQSVTGPPLACLVRERSLDAVLTPRQSSQPTY